MRCRLKKCCFMISLRVGCMISALILVFFALLAVPLRSAEPCCDSFEGILVVVYRVIDIMHFVGCLMLFVASFLKTSALVFIFLVMSCIHILLSPAFLVAEIMVWNADIIDIVLAICGLLLSIYFWIVAYAFYHKCKEEIVADVNLVPTFRKKGSIVSIV
ncbi:uncharacterized protein LOC119557781 [Drosophila subpulchrella]|uniref:uncharacterized protein LOC119557781 n=1 Tax=Drosophila subpulchrella TaxID=1486046 RepID=UPI0018A155FA|nr:uncharacterized protein LOC119557781 [Drosophila subpulchrella]